VSKKYTRSEYGSYQPYSPLTQHYISTGAILPEKKRAPKRPSSTNKQKRKLF
tara:strand:- start:49 stop:204 length:156 start_codon:yes stop_codon:yes gene_type:complete